MVKTISSSISDPRPRINVTLASDDDKTTSHIQKDFVNVQRGSKTAILRVPFGELSGVIELLQATAATLEQHGYDTTGGSDEPLAEPITRARHTAPAVEAPVAQDNPFAAANA